MSNPAERALRHVETELKRLRRAQDSLERRLTTMEGEARNAHDRLAARLDAVEETVGWLEVRVHAQLEIGVADLDAVDDELRRLAEQSRRGRLAEARLLDPATRRRLQAVVDAAERLAGRIAEHDRDALRFSTELAAGEPGTDEHRAARAAYRAVADALARDRAALPAARDQAAEAQRSLDTDAAQRERLGAQVEAGQHAARRLQELMRARLTAAVAETAHLPGWLRFALGRQPSGDIPRWMDTATSLLAYRVTYGVTDPAVALGEHRYDDPRRQAWRDELTTRLRPSPPAPTSRPDPPSG